MGSLKRTAGVAGAGRGPPLATSSGPKAPATKKFATDASIVLTEDTDSFIIGDRVWVGGTKPGVISYIGETQFAPGEWAGVTLDDPIGKNDGSVAGVRYFQCEAKKGVFSRLTRLSRAPLTDYDIELLASRSPPPSSDSPRTNNTPAPSSPARKVTPSAPTPSHRPSTVTSAPTPSHRPSTGTSASSVTSKTSVPTATPAAKKTSTTVPASSFPDLKIGDRVVITSAAGVRHGALRFVGKTDFADGVWAGVELDEPTGKNDGSVAGQKYFECRDKFGLFAPLARVSKFSGGSTRRPSAVPQTPRSGLRRSNSRESLGGSSVASSTASSVRGTRRPTRAPTSSVPNTKALQQEQDAHVVDQDGFY